MSNSVAVTSAPVHNNLSSPALALNMANIGDANGLFLNLMNLFSGQNSMLDATDADATQKSILFGKSGFNFDPALLVLPAGMANLSEEELNSFLTAQSVNGKSILSNDILQSLTTGTPITNLMTVGEIIKTSVSDTKITNNVKTDDINGDLSMLSLNTVNLNELTIGTDAITYANPLLLATGLSPSQMEQMQKQLDASTKAYEDIKEIGDDNNMAFIAFVSIVDQPKLNTLPEDIAIDANIGLEADIVNTDKASSLMYKVNTADAYTDKTKDDVISLLQNAKLTNKIDQNNEKSFDTKSVNKTKLFGQEGGSPDDIDTGEVINNSNDNLSLKKNNNLENHKINNNNASSNGLMHGQFSQFFIAPDDMSGSIPFGLETHASSNALANSNALTAPLLNNHSAASTHPTVHTIAMKIEKAAKSENQEQTLSLQLDPPELGRLQIQLTYEKGAAMKVHLLAEKQETFNLLQRDSHALKEALTQAGVQLDGSSLTFDMAGGGQSFDQMMGGFNHDKSGNSNKEFNLNDVTGEISQGSDITLNTYMNEVPDFSNGNVSYNFFA